MSNPGGLKWVQFPYGQPFNIKEGKWPMKKLQLNPDTKEDVYEYLKQQVCIYMNVLEEDLTHNELAFLNKVTDDVWALIEAERY